MAEWDVRGIAASWLVTGDADTPPIEDGAVVLDRDGRILAVGTSDALRVDYPDADWEDHDAVLTPGLINAHTHLELSALGGSVPGGRGFAAWVEDMLRLRDRIDPDDRATSIRSAVDELVSSGVVAVGEVTNTLDTVGVVAASTLSGIVFHEVLGPTRALASANLEAAERRRARVAQWPAAFGYALAPHTTFTVPPEMIADLVGRARTAGRRTSLHLCEHAHERAFLWDGSGPLVAAFARLGSAPDWPPPARNPVAHVAGLGALGHHVLCVHLTDARPPEIEAIARVEAPVVLCPRSNLHIELRMPPLGQILAAGIQPALGTDSLASAASLDVLDDACALRARFPRVPPRTLLAMAMSWGARALLLGDRLGTLAPGYAPGVLAFPYAGDPPEDPEEWLLAAPRARRVLCPAGQGAP
jgi:cytosine/adenosine deaminase-related metal-dependent hydrolase